MVDYSTGRRGERVRRRKSFTTEAKAKRFAREKSSEIRNYGDQFERFGPAERAELALAYDKAKSFGFTVNEAVTQYAKAQSSLAQSDVTVGNAIEQFLDSRKTKKLRGTTLARYACQLGNFRAGREDQRLALVTREEIEAFLNGNGWKTVTIVSTLKAIKTFFTWAIGRGLVHQDRSKAIESPIVDAAPPTILSVTQARKLIESCATLVPDFLPVVAIGLFAGARTAEIRKLSWDDVDLKRQLIEIRGVASKTRQRRLVDISDNLKVWLKMSGNLPPAQNLEKWKRITLAAGWKPREWPRNAMRHSCASYMLAANQNADKTALQLGHTPQMLFQHYRELVTPDQAREYWEIRP